MAFHCCYCINKMSRTSLFQHMARKHKEVYDELEKIKRDSFAMGRREALEPFYINCSVCELKMLKTSLDQHMKEVHPYKKPIKIPFVIPLGYQLQRRDVANLFQNERTADVRFVFKNQSHVVAHKYILACDSDVFYNMFYGKLKEKGDVKIADTSLDAFVVFLASFYASNMAITEENVDEIMYLGNKYDATKCMKACQDFLTLVLCTENAPTIFGLSILHNCEPLRQLCVKKIIQEGRTIIQLDSFRHCNHDVLKEVLSTNFQGRNELTLLEACVKWAKQLCERENVDTSELPYLRSRLGDCFGLIRFNAMSPLQFIQCLSSFRDILGKDEIIEIANEIATQHANPLNPSSSSTSAVSDVADSVNDEIGIVTKYSSTKDYSFGEIASLFGNIETADVFFILKMEYDEPTRIPAHKCILANNSTEFDKLFFGPDKETEDIQVCTCCVEEFTLFLQSFYGKPMQLTMANVAQVMHFADKYDAQICLFACEEFLESHLSEFHLSSEYLFLIFELSYSYRRAKLYESCVKIIDENHQFFMRTTQFLNLSRETVKHIVMIDFKVRNNFLVFEACIEWAKHACEISNYNTSAENLVDKLGDIFSLIDFTSMTTCEFIQCQINCRGMFNDDILKEILKDST